MKDYDGFRKYLGLQGNDDIVEKALKKMAESDEDYSVDKVGEFFEKIIIEDLKKATIQTSARIKGNRDRITN